MFYKTLVAEKTGLSLALSTNPEFRFSRVEAHLILYQTNVEENIKQIVNTFII